MWCLLDFVSAWSHLGCLRSRLVSEVSQTEVTDCLNIFQTSLRLLISVGQLLPLVVESVLFKHLLLLCFLHLVLFNLLRFERLTQTNRLRLSHYHNLVCFRRRGSALLIVEFVQNVLCCLNRHLLLTLSRLQTRITSKTYSFVLEIRCWTRSILLIITGRRSLIFEFLVFSIGCVLLVGWISLVLGRSESLQRSFARIYWVCLALSNYIWSWGPLRYVLVIGHFLLLIAEVLRITILLITGFRARRHQFLLRVGFGQRCVLPNIRFSFHRSPSLLIALSLNKVALRPAKTTRFTAWRSWLFIRDAPALRRRSIVYCFWFNVCSSAVARILL